MSGKNKVVVPFQVFSEKSECRLYVFSLFDGQLTAIHC